MRTLHLILLQLIFRVLNPQGKLKSLLMWPLASRLLGKNFETVILFPDGYKVKTNMSDTLTRNILFYGPWQKNPLWEPMTLTIAEELGSTAKELIIAGAHIGYIPVYLHNAIQKNARFHVFEPLSSFFALLSDSIKINKIENMKAHRNALSNIENPLILYTKNIRSSLIPFEGAETEEKVTVTTIDSYVKVEGIKKLDFMLIDVEGAEEDVFHGMATVFERGDRPDIIFEVSSRIVSDIEDSFSLLNFLEAYGYGMYIIDDFYENPMDYPQNRPVSLFSAKDNLEKFWSYRNFNVLATVKPLAFFEDLNWSIER